MNEPVFRVLTTSDIEKARLAAQGDPLQFISLIEKAVIERLDAPISMVGENEKQEPWSAFREAGLLWWVNRQLHMFGWSINVVMNMQGEVQTVYPVTTGLRGFSEAVESVNFDKLRRTIAKLSATNINEEDDVQ